MLLFILSFMLLLIITASIIALPFVRAKHSLVSKPFLLLLSAFLTTPVILYVNFTNPKELLQWLTYGKQHYELALQVQALGGIDGLITRLKKKLEEHPNDQKGLEILRRLQSAN